MNAGEAPDDVADAPVAMMLKRGRGRPRKDDAPMVRPAKAGKACTGAVLQVYADDRNRAGKEWVEVAPRPVGRDSVLPFVIWGKFRSLIVNVQLKLETVVGCFRRTKIR